MIGAQNEQVQSVSVGLACSMARAEGLDMGMASWREQMKVRNSESWRSLCLGRGEGNRSPTEAEKQESGQGRAPGKFTKRGQGGESLQIEVWRFGSQALLVTSERAAKQLQGRSKLKSF